MPETPENLRRRAARRRESMDAVQVELSGGLARRIDLLKLRCGLGSRAKVIEQAIDFMEGKFIKK